MIRTFLGAAPPLTSEPMKPILRELINAYQEWNGQPPASWQDLGDFVIGQMIDDIYGEANLDRGQIALRLKAVAQRYGITL